jgi:hypothetical protein
MRVRWNDMPVRRDESSVETCPSLDAEVMRILLSPAISDLLV